MKKSFTKLSKVFTQFDFDFEETLNSLKRGFGNQLGDTSQISRFLREDFTPVLIESLKRLDGVCKYLLQIKQRLPDQFKNEFDRSHQYSNSYKLQTLGAYAYRLFTDPRKVLMQ